jgi:polyhydroxyalkanoate synthase
MSDPRDPASWMAWWTGAAQSAGEAWMKAGQSVLQARPEGAPDVQQLWTGFWQQLFEGAPAGLGEAWAQKAFGQVGAVPPMPDASWMGAAPDPAQLDAALRRSLGEIEGELGKLPADAFAIDFGPLAAAWGRVAGGQGTEADRGMVRRFVDALSVKLRYGPEYYADPERVPVRPTPRHRVHQQGRFDLFRYESTVEQSGPPVLIVYSLINRSYILDLAEDVSVVRHFLDRGLDVFMIEWNGAQSGDESLGLADLVAGIGGCVDAIEEQTGAPRVSLFGHCIGGTLAAMYAALHPDRVERLLTLTAPFQAPAEGVVSAAVDPAVFDVDSVVERHGHMPAKLIRYTFMTLKPWYEALKWKMFVQGLSDEGAMTRFSVVDKWANDNVDIPARVFAEYVRGVFQSDDLVAGRLQIGGRAVDLSAITCPVLDIAAEGDWIAPADSARPLAEQAPEGRFELIPGGHLSLILDPRMHDRWSLLSDFLLGVDA